MFETKLQLSRQRGVRGHYRQNALVFEVARNTAQFKGRKIQDCSVFDKRKFDNALVLENAWEHKPVKTLYVG